MGNTLTNVFLPAGVWVDLYNETGLDVGTKIAVENIGSYDVYLTVLDTQPPLNHDAYNVLIRGGVQLENNEGDLGAWAFSPNADGKVNVRKVV